VLLLSLGGGLLGRVPHALAWQMPSLFEMPEAQVERLPNEPRQLDLAPGEAVLDLAASPTGPEVAVLARPTNAPARLVLWKLASGRTEAIWQATGEYAPQWLAWHPTGQALFVLGTGGGESTLVRLDRTSTGWKAATIFHSKRTLARLVAGPRPFTTDPQNAPSFCRLFFGATRPNGTSLIVSVDEHGGRYYEVTKSKFEGPPASNSAFGDSPPVQFVAESALPVAFHPAGHMLVWEDGAHCFQAARYEVNNWEKSTPILGGKLCGGSVTPTPNGIGLLHWLEATPGVELYVSGEKQTARQAAEYQFLSAPRSVADGRGIVGATKNAKVIKVVYVPIDVPLAKVANAWMFLESPRDRELFSKKAGLFRPLKDNDQLFQLYDSEAYYCGGYNVSTPTRPYLVTTDVFWENFAAAYEGLFVLLERRQAIPMFWEFVQAANAALANTGSPWAPVFHALAQVRTEAPPDDPEAQRILRADSVEHSAVLGRDFNYGELKPRGHYTASEDEKRYFKAFRYLTSAPSEQLPPAELASLPAGVQERARFWIQTYLAFIAPSRAPSLWSGLPGAPPAYARHVLKTPALFPLSFGFDNEVLLSTVFHPDWAEDEQIAGPAGPRLLPSGLDVAAALGNPLARTLLAPEIEKYPQLTQALNSLQARAPAAGSRAPENLYDRWIDALATSWVESAAIPAEGKEDLWEIKRLQTGLASWATLRHATGLVNERTAAECGEGGFEWILLTPPRGYVEPTPDAFESIAGLFDAAAAAVRNSPALQGDSPPSFALERPQALGAEAVALREGVLRRLGESAAKARLFAGIARKELRGEPLSNQDYDEILYINRTAEYHFMIFKSLANESFALANPDPMPKIADVAGGANGVPYLHVAVGAPLEWDQIVPFFGRQEIVKGSVYSYYEFTSPSPLNDAEWRAQLPGAARPAWVSPFVSKAILSCPAKNPY
jgi:hypothetical protein